MLVMMYFSVVTVIFAGRSKLASFYGAKDDGCGSDYWSYKSCKMLQSNRHHQQTNTQLNTNHMPLLSSNQLCQSTEGNISHFTDLLDKV